MKWTLLAVLALTALGCDNSSSTADAPANPPPQATPAATSAETPPARKAKCPLCKDHEIEVTADTPRASHDGKEYFFCSDYCKEDFVKDPAAAIAKHAK
jgi:YHS domain-containing protein